MSRDKGKAPKAPKTQVTTAGRDPFANFGIVNPPVYHASTVLFKTLADLNEAVKKPFDGVYYGRFGTPTTFAFEEAVAEIAGGDKAIATSSGLAAITCALTAFLKSGDHILMVDTVYQPTRKFCDEMLKGFGIETTYYDPLIGDDISDLIRDNTKLVFLESPGSLTFEVQDVPAIVAAAKAKGILTMLDNTWGTPLNFKAFDKGIDISLEAATKYIVGHADAMLGIIICREKHYNRLKSTVVTLGNSPGPDDCYLGLRGLRTLDVRLARHGETGLQLAKWLEGRGEVERVIHPALPNDPGYELWKRDFTGTCGLFAMILKPVSDKALAAMLDEMDLFSMGFSWGGFESLILPLKPEYCRTETSWPPADSKGGPLLRLHAGLEDIDDLIADLDAGFARLNAAT